MGKLSELFVGYEMADDIGKLVTLIAQQSADEKQTI